MPQIQSVICDDLKNTLNFKESKKAKVTTTSERPKAFPRTCHNITNWKLKKMPQQKGNNDFKEHKNLTKLLNSL